MQRASVINLACLLAFVLGATLLADDYEGTITADDLDGFSDLTDIGFRCRFPDYQDTPLVTLLQILEDDEIELRVISNHEVFALGSRKLSHLGGSVSSMDQFGYLFSVIEWRREFSLIIWIESDEQGSETLPALWRETQFEGEGGAIQRDLQTQSYQGECEAGAFENGEFYTLRAEQEQD